MNRPIKFRGRVINTGEFVFGDLAHTEVGVLIGAHEVEPESVAQLVGFDADDREVYEGDTIVLQNGAEYVAKLFGNITSPVKLKEAQS